MDRNLLDYLPPVLQDKAELKAVMEAEQPEIKALWDKIDIIRNDQYIETTTETGASRREKILSIVPKATDSLEARRFRITVRWNEQLPFTMTTLRQQLEALCGEDGYSATLNLNNYTLVVKINLIAKSNFDDVDTLLHRITPENLVIDLDLKYNQHITLAEFTHQMLSMYTHDQLRNEVLKNGG